MTAQRDVELVPLADLRPDPRNPKNHREEVIDASIGRFGVLDLIVRDDRTGFIVSGHGRAKALRTMFERGESAPEGVTLAEDGKWLVPVVVGWASRTDSEAAAALVALNRTTELGGWDDEALLAILEGLEAVDGGFDGVGFDERELADLQKSLTHHEDLDALADEWNGEGLADMKPQTASAPAPGAKPVLTIPIVSPATAEMWQAHLEGFGSPDAALFSLLKALE